MDEFFIGIYKFTVEDCRLYEEESFIAHVGSRAEAYDVAKQYISDYRGWY